jgi:hypothetical protein
MGYPPFGTSNFLHRPRGELPGGGAGIPVVSRFARAVIIERFRTKIFRQNVFFVNSPRINKVHKSYRQQKEEDSVVPAGYRLLWDTHLSK